MFESWPLYSGVEESVRVHPPHPHRTPSTAAAICKRSIAQSSCLRAGLVSAVVEVTEWTQDACGEKATSAEITLFKVVSVSLSLPVRVPASLLFIVLRSHSCVFLS